MPLDISWSCFAEILYLYSVVPYLCNILCWDCFKGELLWCALQQDYCCECCFLTCSMSALHSRTVTLNHGFSVFIHCIPIWECGGWPPLFSASVFRLLFHSSIVTMRFVPFRRYEVGYDAMYTEGRIPITHQSIFTTIYKYIRVKVLVLKIYLGGVNSSRASRLGKCQKLLQQTSYQSNYRPLIMSISRSSKLFPLVLSIACPGPSMKSFCMITFGHRRLAIPRRLKSEGRTQKSQDDS